MKERKVSLSSFSLYIFIWGQDKQCPHKYMTFIYLLEFKNNTYYIGKTNNVIRRIREHNKKSSLKFDYIILDEVENWKFWESYWIEQFKQWGFILLNKNNGGGGPGFHTGESKKKISIRLSKRKITWNDKMSQNRKGIKHNRIKPMPKHIIDTLPKDEIIKEYTLGNKSADYISSLYNVSTVTILNLLKQNGIKPTKNKINDDIKQQIINDYKDHYNINKISSKFNISRITIKNHLKVWGLFKDQRKTY